MDRLEVSRAADRFNTMAPDSAMRLATAETFNDSTWKHASPANVHRLPHAVTTPAYKSTVCLFALTSGVRSRKPCDLELLVLRKLGADNLPSDLPGSLSELNVDLTGLTCGRCVRRGIVCSYVAPDAARVGRIWAVRSEILDAETGSNRRKKQSVDNGVENGVENGPQSMHHEFHGISLSNSPGATSTLIAASPPSDSIFQLSRSTVSHLIELYALWLYASIPILDLAVLRTHPESYPQPVLDAIIASAAFLRLENPHGEVQAERVAEEALLKLKRGLGMEPSTESDWLEVSHQYIEKSMDGLRAWLVPLKPHPINPTESTYALIALIHHVFSSTYIYENYGLAGRYFRFCAALARELETGPRNHEGELARRAVWTLYCLDRSTIFSVSSTLSAWILQEELVASLALPCEYHDLQTNPGVTLSSLKTPEEIVAHWPLLNPFAIMCLLFHFRSRISDLQSNSMGSIAGQFLHIAEARASVLRALIDTVELQLRGTAGTWPWTHPITPLHLLILANACKMILSSPPTIAEMISSDSVWVSSPAFVQAFEAAAAICEHLAPLTSTPEELDKLPVLLWPCLARVAVLLVSLLRKLRTTAPDPTLDALLRTNLDLHIATIRHLGDCKKELGVLAGVLQALADNSDAEGWEAAVLSVFPGGR